MNNNQNLKVHALRTAVLRYYIADAFISLMARVHNEPVYIEDGERIELTHEKVVSNIIYHIEMPWVNEFGADAGCILAAEKLEKMLKPGFMSENIRLSVLVSQRCVRFTGILFSVHLMANYPKVLNL